MYRGLLVLTISLFVVLMFVVKPATAAECTIIYGGGQMSCPKTTPTLAPRTPIESGEVGSQISPTNSNQTKGGLPVYEQTNASTTPATGPEMLGLISLIPMAAAGFYLRKRTKK